jgi:hypothetical protein
MEEALTLTAIYTTGDTLDWQLYLFTYEDHLSLIGSSVYSSL